MLSAHRSHRHSIELVMTNAGRAISKTPSHHWDTCKGSDVALGHLQQPTMWQSPEVGNM